MDWDRIRIFLEVARTGQILGASRRLGVNHATVARQLTALEQELKTQLVERRTTGSVLTSAGEALVAAAERAESEFLRVGATLGRSPGELLPCGPAWRACGPTCRLAHSTCSPAADILAVEAGGRYCDHVGPSEAGS